MRFFSEFLKLVKAPFSVDNYYKALNLSLKRVNNEYTMLHYPFFVNATDSLLQSQKNLTDHCLSFLGQIKDKTILEIGCGNGVQLIYISSHYKPSEATGIDLNQANIDIANTEKERLKLEKISFSVNNAQNLKGINDNQFDLIICIESAFHYPDKQSFLSEVFRVLKPGGKFLIADIVSRSKSPSGLIKYFGKKLHLNHWTRERYHQGFRIAGLEHIMTSDITEQVIHGFQNYPKWLSQIRSNAISGFGHMIFYKSILYFFIYLLKKWRNYDVYIGKKY